MGTGSRACYLPPLNRCVSSSSWWPDCLVWKQDPTRNYKTERFQRKRRVAYYFDRGGLMQAKETYYQPVGKCYPLYGGISGNVNERRPPNEDPGCATSGTERPENCAQLPGCVCILDGALLLVSCFWRTEYLRLAQAPASLEDEPMSRKLPKEASSLWTS